MVIGPGGPIEGVQPHDESTPRVIPRRAASDRLRPSTADERRAQVIAAEVRLLYENAGIGTVATLVIAALLAFTQRNLASPVTLWAWLLSVVFVAALRLLLARWYWRVSPGAAEVRPWQTRFVLATGLAAVGWGVAGIVLYPATRSMATHEVLVVFVIGGVMLGGASLLAARPEAFLTFLLPAGLLTAARVAFEGDEEHLVMGLLAGVFTIATVLTTWRFHHAIESSFLLRFDKQELIESLQAAKDDADALNRELEVRVRERTAQLTDADRRKDEFLATLAHELRNPLAPIRFAVDVLNRDGSSAARMRARDVIERQVAQLVRLVDDLLDVSRITADKIRLRREPLDLGQLMATAVESIASAAEASEQVLDVRLPSVPVAVDGDGARLVQVFSNILNNAVKFTPRGGSIWFTAERSDLEVFVRVRDTGVGIRPEALPLVFDMFHQAEPGLDRAAGGLGIGLTLARRLVEMHGGRIRVTSPGIGRGAEVEIRLPIATAVRPAIRDAPPAAPGRRLRVLIVEDNVDAAEMLQLAVAELGHATRVAHDGASALTAAAEFAPDVIFLDIGLPVMDGYSVASALRARREFDHVHIAALTGWGQDADRRKAREAGCDSHFTKPLDPATLESVLAGIAQRGLGRASGGPRTRLADSGGAL